jgi:hypothetical protein
LRASDSRFAKKGDQNEAPRPLNHRAGRRDRAGDKLSDFAKRRAKETGGVETKIDLDWLLRVRVAVARCGEMDAQRWWNTEGQLGP